MLKNKDRCFNAFLMLTLIVSCSFKTASKSTDQENSRILNDSILSFKIEKNINAQCSEDELKSIVKNQLSKGSGDSIKFKDVESVKYWGVYKLRNINQALIFKIKLSYDLPSVWHYSMALIIDNTNHNGYIVDLDVIEPIKIQQDNDVYYFAGRYKNRYGYGTFKIFKFSNNRMYDIFESEEAVSNFSNDCISYENDDLKLQNIDLNNDGYLDLKFTGIKNHYCKGYEQYGKDERKPIKKEKVTIIYYFNENILKWEK